MEIKDTKINAAEQLIINYYNQTFSYGGKTYVATEAAKASVYQKLASDDVDMTERQAKPRSVRHPKI